MKIKHLYLLLTLILGTVLVFTAFQKSASAGTDSGVKRKIKFNHRLHKEAAECTACHSSITKSGSLNEGLYPKKDDCAGCHDVNDEKSCNLCHIDNNYEALQSNYSQLYFNHAKHLEKEKDCLKCHKGIDEDDNTDISAKYNPSMQSCYSCHGSLAQGPSSCETCHKNTADLIPQSHRTGNFSRSHKFAVDAPGANCAMCHDEASCGECHNPTTGIPGDNSVHNFFMPYASTLGGLNKLQRLNRVHEPGFRFTHGLEAETKDKECSTCHQMETFCVTCHDSKTKQDYAYGGMIPDDHKKSSFLVFGGYGSGGGDHATLARRDIERCASCHDTQGGDPVCISCHVDNDGILGTNPRTHKPGAMRDIGKGDWHESSSSICYNCHTDPNARPSGVIGVGFCKYCHQSEGKR